MPSRRKRRVQQHIVGDAGVNHVAGIVVDAGFVPLVVPGGSDYGTDILLFTFDAQGRAENGDLRVQVKTSAHLKRLKRSNAYDFDISKRDLQLWLNETSPFVLVLFGNSTGSA